MHNEAFETITLFVKICLAVGATMLLFLNDRSVKALRSSSPPISLVSEVCLGAFFVASVLLVAVWDSTMAVLVCLFLVCWIAALRWKPPQTTRPTPPAEASATHSAGRRSEDQRVASEAVSRMQAVKIQTQAALDNAGPLKYALDTPLPTENEQTSLPMAFAMADRSYSTASNVQNV